MNMEEVKALISEQGWTPQIKTRRRTRKQYLYAARRIQGKMEWRYIGVLPRIETVQEQEILTKLSR